MKNLSSRTILWLVFSASIVMLWQQWNTAHAPLPVAATSTSTASNASSANTATASATPASTAVLPTNLSVKPAGQSIVMKNDKISLKVNTEGGVIEYAELLDYRDSKDKTINEVLFTTENNRIYVSRSGVIDNNAANNIDHKAVFTASATEAVLQEGANDVSLVLTSSNSGVKLTKTYTLHRGSYVLDVNHEIDNIGATAIQPQVYLDLTRDSVDLDKSFFYSTYNGPVIYNAEDKFKKVAFSDILKGDAKFTANADNGWTGMLQHYFVSAWVLPNNEVRAREFAVAAPKKDDKEQVYSVRQIIPVGSIAPAAKAQLATQLYVGPQDQQVLGALATGLERSVDYGWATLIATPIHWVMTFIHQFIPNWGWTIVVLTILMKLALFPLTAASYKSMAKMKLLAPRLKALQETHKDDRMKMNQATMELYKSEKVNPAGGCLPMLIQMPVFLALYYVLQSAVEMRGAPWLGWVQDLSLPDHFYILPALMVVTMLVQTRLNPKPADPMQAKMMTWMPLIFGVTFFWFPAGLVLYWVVSNTFSIFQQHFMNKKFGIKDSLIPLKEES
ncbi:MAG: membrane protein insertase YidC [Formosimonas sp.]|jgi:YidC/Oxa1 family membrane protein insertase